MPITQFHKQALSALKFRLSVNGGSDKHSLRKDGNGGGFGRARYVKSPEKLEAQFSMTTIEEEEQENFSAALSLKNLNQIDDISSLQSFDENPED